MIKRILFLMVISLFFISCGNKPKDLILGKWKRIDGPGSVEYLKDGTILQTIGAYQNFSAKYSFIEDDRILVKSDDGKFSTMWRISINENKLIARDENNNQYSIFIRNKYDWIGDFEGSNFALIKQDGLWGVIDRNGKVIFSPEYYKIAHGFLIKKSNKAAMADWSTGKILTDFKYDYDEETLGKEAKEGETVVKIGSKYGTIDSMGKEIIPIIYDHLYYNRESLGWDHKLNKEIIKQYYKVVLDGRPGYLDVNYNFVASGIDKLAGIDVLLIEKLDEQPTFPNGDKALYAFIGRHIVYPKNARMKGVEGKLYVEFVVRTDGKVTDVHIQKGIGGGCDEEAVKVVKSLPNWKPGKVNGHPVNVRISIPIVFKLQ